MYVLTNFSLFSLHEVRVVWILLKYLCHEGRCGMWEWGQEYGWHNRKSTEEGTTYTSHHCSEGSLGYNFIHLSERTSSVRAQGVADLGLWDVLTPPRALSPRPLEQRLLMSCHTFTHYKWRRKTRISLKSPSVVRKELYQALITTWQCRCQLAVSSRRQEVHTHSIGLRRIRQDH